MSEIFSSINPFTDIASCDTPLSLTSPQSLIHGINCPPSECATSGVFDPNVPYTFLNCYIIGLNGKVGLGGEESYVTIDLIDPNPKSCSYINTSQCPDPAFVSGYSGALGGIYTVQIGGFSFRGILTKHDYQEGSDGWKYSVTLSDGKQVLSHVTVITNGYYSNVKELQPNLINAVAITNASVAQNVDCLLYSAGDGYLCEDFGAAGVNQKGMYVKHAIQAIHGKKCKIPESGLCLTINLDYLIGLVNDQARLSSDFMSALEIIDYACNESGYAFLTQIIDDEIIIIPVSQKKTDLPVNIDKPLFDFMNSFDQDIIISRDYGEELTYNKSQKLILGQQYRYILSIDHTGFLCNGTDYINTEPTPSSPPCRGLHLAGAYSYQRIDHDYFSGGGTIIGNTLVCDQDYMDPKLILT